MNPSSSTLWMQRRRPTLFLLSIAYSDEKRSLSAMSTAASRFHQTARHGGSLWTNLWRWKNDTWPSQIRWRSKTLFFDPKNWWQRNILCFCQFLRNAKHSWNLKTPQFFSFDKMVRHIMSGLQIISIPFVNSYYFSQLLKLIHKIQTWLAYTSLVCQKSLEYPLPL